MKIIQSISKKKILLILMWIGVFGSINTNVLHVSVLLDNKINFSNIINFTRSIYPLMLILVFIFFALAKYKKIKILKKTNIVLLFYLFFLLFQLVGFLNISNTEQNIENLYFHMSAFSVLLFLMIVNFYNNEIKIYYLFLSLLLFLVSLILIFMVIKLAPEYWENLQATNFYKLFSVSFHSNFFGTPAPRITGLSRIAILLMIIFLVQSLYSNKNRFYFFGVAILGGFIWLAQSRGAYYSLLIVITSLLFLAKKISLSRKLQVLALAVVVPLIFSQSLFLLKNYSNNYDAIFTSMSDSQLKKEFERCQKKGCDAIYLKKLFDWTVKNNDQKNIAEEQYRIVVNMSSSGRFNDWKKIGSVIKTRLPESLLGFGPQADRMLIKETASNSYLSALLTGGVLGLISLMCLVFLNLYNSFYLIFKSKIFCDENCNYLKITIIINLFFILRGVYESSFSVYGLDFLFFIISSTIINHEKEKISKKAYQ